MKNIEYYQTRAKEIIKSIHYLTLSTVTPDAKPWNSPLAYSVDNNFNFYFGSPKNTQHSENIKNNENAFVVIYDSTAPDGQGEGVYFTAKVKELANQEEVKHAIEIMFGAESNYNVSQFIGESKLRAYKITPESVWMNDAEEKERRLLEEAVKKALHCIATITACCVIGTTKIRRKNEVWTIFDKVSRQTKMRAGALLTVEEDPRVIKLLDSEDCEQILPESSGIQLKRAQRIF